MKNTDIIYINFPISFLQDAFWDIQNTMNYILRYATYKHAKQLDYGDEENKVKAAAKFFKIIYNDINSVKKTYELLFKKYNFKSPNVSINIDIVWDFHDKKKSEFDIACFCAFCAIRSILGGKEYVKTNKALILARMFGKNSVQQEDKENEVLIVKQLKLKYAKRYHIDKVLIELQFSWGLKLYSDHSRGFYVSFKKELTDLAVINEIAKKGTKKAALVNEKKKAKEEAKKRLGL